MSARDGQKPLFGFSNPSQMSVMFELRILSSQWSSPKERVGALKDSFDDGESSALECPPPLCCCLSAPSSVLNCCWLCSDAPPLCLLHIFENKYLICFHSVIELFSSYGVKNGIRDACSTVDIFNGCSSGLLVV